MEELEVLSDGSIHYNGKPPLLIEMENEKDYIEVTITKWFKGKEDRVETVRSNKVRPMTKEQVHDFILDCVDKFNRK